MQSKDRLQDPDMQSKDHVQPSLRDRHAGLAGGWRAVDERDHPRSRRQRESRDPHFTQRRLKIASEKGEETSTHRTKEQHERSMSRNNKNIKKRFS